MSYYAPLHKFPPSVTRDYNVVQGVSHPSDLSTQVIRNYNVRYVTVENSSPHNPIGISIANSFEMTPIPPIKFSLAPGEIRHLAINTIGGQMQYIHIIDLNSKKHVGDPYAFRTDSNQFVLRDGINKWFVTPYKRASYNAAH
jgi:hypothetical protein